MEAKESALSRYVVFLLYLRMYIDLGLETWHRHHLDIALQDFYIGLTILRVFTECGSVAILWD